MNIEFATDHEKKPNLHRFLATFDLLTKEDVIGRFRTFEFVELFGFKRGSLPFNVLSIAVASGTLKPTDPTFLCQRIRVPGLHDFAFGIRRSVVTIKRLRNAIQTLATKHRWEPLGDENRVGELRPLEHRFVPANSLNQIALNMLVKNNFFNGCYLLELFDCTKEHVSVLFEDPNALASLSAALAEVIPMDIGSVSDRLGNVLLQFPVEILRADFGNDGNAHSVEVAWHPDAEPRKVSVIGSVYHDKTPVAFGCAEVVSGQVEVCPDAEIGVLHGYVWDNEQQLLLAATDECAFISRISINMQPVMPEPRVFPNSLEEDGEQVRVQLSSSSLPSQVGDFQIETITDPIQSRIYDEERQQLAARRAFVQYSARPKREGDDRGLALEDVRSLISQHGASGAWLWDPYLSPQDIVDTLFWNKNAGSPMRALTRLKEVKKCGAQPSVSKVEQVGRFATKLSSMDSNLLGLNIEFRSAHGPNGWDFHDRFLIIPPHDGVRAQAWSLGTSVNSLGKAHHILQQVDNAQLVASAFEQLWNAVEGDQNLVWKHP